MEQKYLDCFEYLTKNIYHSIIENDGLDRIITPWKISSIEDNIINYRITSNQVNFGNSLEKLSHVLIEELSGNFLPKRQGNLDFDVLFTYKNSIVLIEQKVRDDHDSSKKRGQLENYKAKKDFIKKQYSDFCLYSCMWFIDPSKNKNKNYYIEETSKEEILYGKEINDFLKQIFSKEINLYETMLNIVTEIANTKIIFDKVDFKEYTPSKLFPFFKDGDLNTDINKMFFGEINKEDFIKYLKTQRRVDKQRKLLEIYDN